MDRLHDMRMGAMAEELERQLATPKITELHFEERIGLMVDAEWTAREQRRLTRRLQLARLRYPASIEDIDFRTKRGLDRELVLSLSNCDWLQRHQGLLIIGPTGVGKSYLTCAFVERACRAGYSARYVRTPRLLHEMAVARGDGTYGQLLARLAKVDPLAFDDWLLNPLKDSERRDLLEIVEDRYQRRSTLIATQLPVTSWHEAIGDETLADAICDRLVHEAHHLTMNGPSMRRKRAAKK